MKPPRSPLLTAAAALLCFQSALAQEVGDPLELSLEELMQVVVTSVSRKAQTLAETAAAAYVIRADDIRRSGASNIPEALRLAPGVQVSAIGANKWAVSIRGQADRFSNKLLVLVDGRSVYSPMFSGVVWETLDVPLENIERIEVIRGPGASIWGANLACAWRSAHISLAPNSVSLAAWPFSHTTSSLPSSCSQRLSSPQTWR